MIKMKNLEEFFKFARERYQVKLNKEANLPWPWTKDEILQKYVFCNIHREDDKTTKWIRKNITFEKYGEFLLGALVIARWFNRIETLELLIFDGNEEDFRDHGYLHDCLCSWFFYNEQFKHLNEWNLNEWKITVKKTLENVSPIITGAYMIKTPAKMSKLDGVLWCLEQFLFDSIELSKKFIKENYTLEKATETLKNYPYLGAFMAYEIVTDLRHTPILNQASDILSWANPGPGCARGLCRLLNLDLDGFNRHSKKDVEEMLDYMREILSFSKNSHYWPQNWTHWEMREVEHTLCEFDKYQRVKDGGTSKRLYHKPNITKHNCLGVLN